MAEIDILLAPTFLDREVAGTPKVTCKNRFIEPNQILNHSSYSFISRPGLNKWLEVGEGPIRKVFSEPGVFNSDLFVISGTFLYRVNNLGIIRIIGELSPNPIGDITMAAAAPIGEGFTATPAYLYIAEGGVLWVYTENGNATARLEASGIQSVISVGDQVEIDGVYYQFSDGNVDTGTPDGTMGNPWLVDYEQSLTSAALTNLFRAINGTGVAGTDYSSSLTIHPTVTATVLGSLDLSVTANLIGAEGNNISISETSTGLTWDSSTLTGGGSEQLRQVDMPQGLGALSVAHINSYIIVIPAQDELAGTVGRFYFIEPGEVIVDPLNFATAERSPDKINQVVVFNDLFWLCGETTTEPWLITGDISAPVQRYQSIMFDRGCWNGTAIQVKDSLVLVDEDGAAFQISGGLNRISNPAVEEAFRNAIRLDTTNI